MSKGSGVTGKTVEQLRRSIAGKAQQEARDQRTAAEQLKLIDQRPGKSARERRKLEIAVNYDSGS